MIHLSGVVVHAHPKNCNAVKNSLLRLPGVEVHAINNDGRMVVTIEDSPANMIQTMNAFQDIKGVISASLIYHHLEHSDS